MVPWLSANAKELNYHYQGGNDYPAFVYKGAITAWNVRVYDRRPGVNQLYAAGEGYNDASALKAQVLGDIQTILTAQTEDSVLDTVKNWGVRKVLGIMKWWYR
jgi:hypothetical protein